MQKCVTLAGEINAVSRVDLVSKACLSVGFYISTTKMCVVDLVKRRKWIRWQSHGNPALHYRGVIPPVG